MNMNNRIVEFIKYNCFDILCSIPKTIYINFKLFPLKQAIKFPIFISYNIKLKNINKKNIEIISKKLSTASIRIGFGGSYCGYNKSKRGLLMIKNGKIIISDKVGLSRGVVINVENANLRFGSNFRCNYSTIIDCCNKDINIGNDVACGWNVVIKNFDGHYILVNGKKTSNASNITIGNHVWLCSNSTVLKGVNLGNNCVLAYGSILTKADGKDNALFAGVPAKIIRETINWKE